MSQLVTTPQQSKSLLLAGLNPNTADFYWEFRHFWYVGEAFKDRTDENLTYLHYREECTWRKKNIPKDNDMIFDEGQCASFKFIPAWSFGKLWEIRHEMAKNHAVLSINSRVPIEDAIEGLVNFLCGILRGYGSGEIDGGPRIPSKYLALPPNI